MFTAVVLVALFGGGEAASFGHHGGCCGGGCYGGCMGCYGGCHGGKHHGCCGGGHGCHGHKHHGCCGGCYGGCYGSCYGGSYGSCYGGTFGCYGGIGVGGIGGMATPVAPVTTPATTPAKTTRESAAPATIVVNVPADAKVTVDGEATTSTSNRRVFVSPALNVDEVYHYTLEAELNQDGKTIIVKKQIAVRGGEETEVSLQASEVSSVASR